MIGQDQHLCGIAVDRFIGEQDLVVRPLDPRLGNVPHISAAALTEEGQPLLIVDVEDLAEFDPAIAGRRTIARHDLVGYQRQKAAAKSARR